MSCPPPKRARHALAALTVASASVTPLALANEPAEAVLPTVQVTAAPDANRTPYAVERIPSAARMDAHILDVPVSVQAVPRAVMEEQGVLRAADAARNVSGVTRKPAYLGLTDSYRVRGFDAPIGLWNGFRRDHYTSFTDMSHLEQVEVIKGAASINYGFLEPGGVVNYVTKRPSRDPKRSVQLTAGSYGLVRPEFDIDTRFGAQDTIGLRLTGAYEKADSFRDHVESRLGTLGAALDWDLSAATRLSLSAYLFDSEVVPDRGFFNSLGPIALTLPRERFLGEPADRYSLDQQDLTAELSHRFNAVWSARVGVNRTRVEDDRNNFQQGALQPDGRTIARTYTIVPSSAVTSTAFAELRAALGEGSVKHQISVGLERLQSDSEYTFYRRAATGIDIYNPVYGADRTPPAAPAFSDDTRTRSMGLYAQDLVSFGEQWKVLAGLRYDRFRSNTTDRVANTTTSFAQSELTPRLGVVYQPTVEWSVYGSLATSFRPQTGTRLASGATPDPERGEQAEIGIKHATLDGRVSASAALFSIRKRNVATADPADATNTFSVLAGEQRSRGLELDARARIATNWNLIASYTYTDAFVAQDNTLQVGDRLVNVPRHQASLWARHDFAAWPGVGAGLGAFYTGKREAQLPNTYEAPGYVRMDAGLFWKVRSGMDVALHVKNLANRRYFDSQDNLLYPGAPRTFLATVRTSF